MTRKDVRFLSTTPDYIVDKNAKKFDQLLSRARRPRVYVISPSTREKGSSVIGYRKEEGLFCIVNSYKKQVQDTRQKPRRSVH